MNNRTDEMNEFINAKIDKLSITGDFWLIRTENGRWFNDFTLNEFVAIGWDEVPNLDTYAIEADYKKWRKKVIADIRSIYPKGKDESKAKSPGYILSQIYKFEKLLKIGDHVIVPTESSQELEIGIISSLEVGDFTRNHECKEQCDYRRKYKVKWIGRIRKSSLSGQAWLAFYSHQTVVKLTDYADVICRKIYPLYILNDKVHFTLPVAMKRNLSAEEFFSFSKLLEIADGIGEKLDIDFSKSDLDLKVTLQSPGDFHFIAAGRTAMIGTVFMAFLLASCSDNQDDRSQYELSSEQAKHIKDFSSNANTISSISDSLENSQKRNLNIAKAAIEVKALASRVQ